MHRLEAEYWGRIDFVYYDRENPDNQAIMEQFGITYQPVFVLLMPDGTEVKRWFSTTENQLREGLDDFLATYEG